MSDIFNHFNEILNHINNHLYTYFLVILLIVVGVYYTLRLGFVQIRLLGEAFRVVSERTHPDDKHEEHISPFQSLMISTASRVGIGNIAGIAFAITVGGPGAVFWMWAMAFFGGASAFAESTLAQIYKTKDGNGFKGGPAYYMQRALGQKWMGTLFAIALILTYAWFAVFYHDFSF